MRLDLQYGRGAVGVDLPDDWDVTVFRKKPMPVLADPEGEIERVLRAPLGAPPLAELARGARDACILICDITRPVPNGLILKALVKCLLAAGMQADNIRVLVATGLHRPNEGDELAELVGDRWVLDTVRVENHDARNDGDHEEVGTTSKGTRVLLDRRFLQAELKIATGLVEPHFMAGYSGGRKVIMPGVAHRETITRFHSARFMEHPRAVNCVLEGNPLHEEQLEVVGMIGGALAVNAVIDEKRRPAFLNFGEIVQSHLAAVEYIRPFAEISSERRFKTVVSSTAGYPLDKTYYQTVKGMVGPLEILEPGGNLIIASECSEGMGSPAYVEAQRRLVRLGPSRFLEEIKAKSHADIDEWQSEMQLKPMQVGAIHLYTQGLSPEERALTGVHLIDSLEGAIRQSVAETNDKSLAVVPEGPYVVPVYRP